VNLNILNKKITKNSTSQRFIEIDMLRGLAILLMVFGHLLWDLDHFGISPINNTLYSTLQGFVPHLFFVLVGMGIIVSKKKIENKPNIDENLFYKRLILRGLKIFGLGMILTIGSFIVMPDTPVYFGVLHCIGLSVILTAPFLKYRNFNVLFVFLFITGGYMISQINFQNPSLIHLTVGFHPTNVWKYTVDYFPLLPWFGFTLAGIAAGDILYCGDKRRFRMPDISKYKPAKLFSWMGKHSLGIYLIHQPIIAGAISVFILL